MLNVILSRQFEYYDHCDLIGSFALPIIINRTYYKMVFLHILFIYPVRFFLGFIKTSNSD